MAVLEFSKQAERKRLPCAFTHNERVALRQAIESPGLEKRIWHRVIGLDDPKSTCISFMGFAKGVRAECRITRTGDAYEVYTGRGTPQEKHDFPEALTILKTEMDALLQKTDYPLAPMSHQKRGGAKPLRQLHLVPSS